MTSVAPPRSRSSMVRSSTMKTSGRWPSTFWAYHMGVEVAHQLTMTASWATAANVSLVQDAASVFPDWSARIRVLGEAITLGARSAAATTTATAAGAHA